MYAMISDHAMPSEEGRIIGSGDDAEKPHNGISSAARGLKSSEQIKSSEEDSDFKKSLMGYGEYAEEPHNGISSAARGLKSSEQIVSSEKDSGFKKSVVGSG